MAISTKRTESRLSSTCGRVLASKHDQTAQARRELRGSVRGPREPRRGDHRGRALRHTSPVTSPRVSCLGARGRVGGPFHRGRNGPGGWVLLDEPELHFGDDVLVPDIAGWRRERMPALPSTAYFALAPDWLCEVLSPSTETIDRTLKLAIYAAQGVGHVWLVNPLLETLEVLRLESTALVVGRDARRQGERACRAVRCDRARARRPVGMTRSA